MKIKEILGNITKNPKNGQPNTYIRTKALKRNNLTLKKFMNIQIKSKDSVKCLMKETGSERTIKEMMYEED